MEESDAPRSQHSDVKEEQKRARAEWAQHLAALREATENPDIDRQEFAEASEFFERLTGIGIPGGHSQYIDWHPIPETAQALPLLEKWCRLNCDKLIWDNEKQQVVVESDSLN